MQQEIFKFTVFSISVTIIGGIILGIVFFLLSPYQSTLEVENVNLQTNFLSVGVFYGGVLIFFTGLFATIFFWVRNKLTSSRYLYTVAKTSLRQGFLIGILSCGLLFLQSLSFLIWWDVLLAIIAVILVEMYLAVSEG